jgi:flagellar motor component MotA
MKNDKLRGIQFTEKEKESCMPLIHKLLGFSIAAREKGLLILEYEIEKEPDDYFKKGLQMIVNGERPAEVESTLQSIINEEKSSEIKLLEQYIIMRGILLLQGGEPTHKLAAELLSFLDGESAPEPDDSDLPDDLRLDTITAKIDEGE